MSPLSAVQLDAIPARPVAGADFDATLAEHGVAPLMRGRVTILQVNLGTLCNMACRHCHVDAGPKRTEIMPPRVAERVVKILAANPGVEVLDLTGGAPELNPSFRWLVTEARRLGRRVIDRCNLTILRSPGHEDFATFLAEHGVEVVASLPCYDPKNVDRQRGRGTFEKSVIALRRLNELGYGHAGSPLQLDLVYNPVGPYLPPSQAALEAEYKEELGRRFGLEFHRLLTMTNMPIKRFADFLEQTGNKDAYVSLLVNHFNPATVSGLMCRTLLSVGWDGQLFDCDFDQMLAVPLGADGARTLWEVTDLDALAGRRIATGSHCFGCTAGAGSSCGGALR